MPFALGHLSRASTWYDRCCHAGSVSWYTVTVVLLMMSLLFAITIPSIFIAIELTGATAGVLIAFFWPMVLLLKVTLTFGYTVQKRP